MKQFFIVLTLIFPITLPSAAFDRESARFLSVLPEMPLMPGVDEVPDSAFIFEGASGRIIEVTAVSHINIDAIQTFYATSLPQLGWIISGVGEFRQDDEILRIKLILDWPEPTQTGLRFVLHPRKVN